MSLQLRLRPPGLFHQALWLAQPVHGAHGCEDHLAQNLERDGEEQRSRLLREERDRLGGGRHRRPPATRAPPRPPQPRACEEVRPAALEQSGGGLPPAARLAEEDGEEGSQKLEGEGARCLRLLLRHHLWLGHLACDGRRGAPEDAHPVQLCAKGALLEVGQRRAVGRDAELAQDERELEDGRGIGGGQGRNAGHQPRAPHQFEFREGKEDARARQRGRSELSLVDHLPPVLARPQRQLVYARVCVRVCFKVHPQAALVGDVERLSQQPHALAAEAAAHLAQLALKKGTAGIGSRDQPAGGDAAHDDVVNALPL
eukprot:scaffold32285_cov130-Isochrysis_galbana.AAC.3